LDQAGCLIEPHVSLVHSLHKRLVYVTPAPIFAGLERLNDGVTTGVVMLGGMLVGGGVAAADVAAGEADPQMDPPATGFETIFTPFLGAGGYFLNLIKVLANHYSFLNLPLGFFHILTKPLTLSIIHLL
jgi:hypothetical protein